MADLPRKMMIDWLVSDRFPVKFPFGRAIGRAGLSSGADQFAEGLVYRAELEALDDEALKSRYEGQALPKFKAIEDAHPFNQPGAKPDYAHWAKMAYWTADEGIALLLGRSPHYLEWEKVKHIASPVVRQFAAIRETAKRAVQFKTLNANERPGSFIAWAKRFDFPLPAELEERVASYGHFIGDWYTNYQALQELYQALQKNYEALKEQGQQDHRKALAALEDVGTKWGGCMRSFGSRQVTTTSAQWVSSRLETPRSTSWERRSSDSKRQSRPHHPFSKSRLGSEKAIACESSLSAWRSAVTNTTPRPLVVP